VAVLIEDFAHNLLYLFIRDLFGLFVEDISLLLVDNVEVSCEIMADFIRGLRAFGDQRWRRPTRVPCGTEREQRNERLTFSESACFSIEIDSLLEDFSLSDILESLGAAGTGARRGEGTLRASSKGLVRVLYWTETQDCHAKCPSVSHGRMDQM